MKGQSLSKFNILLGYSTFFIIINILLVGYAGTVLTSPFGLVAPPTCSTGVFIIDGLLTCFFNYLTFFFALFTINSTIFIVETIFVIPFVLMLAVIVLDWLRGTS